MNVVHVVEVATVLRAPLAPRGAKRLARAFVDALSRVCALQGRRSSRRSRRVARLLADAVAFLRGAMVRELRAAREKVGAGRASFARLLGVTASWVARAERGEALFDVERWTRVRSLGRGGR